MTREEMIADTIRNCGGCGSAGFERRDDCSDCIAAVDERLDAEREDLIAALAGLVGLVELVIPTLEGFQRVGVEENHRLTAARAAIAKAGKWKTR